MKKLILILTVLSLLFTLFASVTALATENVPVECIENVSENVQNPHTGDILFGLFVVGALSAIITLYILMRRRYIK